MTTCPSCERACQLTEDGMCSWCGYDVGYELSGKRLPPMPPQQIIILGAFGSTTLEEILKGRDGLTCSEFVRLVWDFFLAHNMVHEQDLTATKAAEPYCSNCRSTGVVETGNNDLPCEECVRGKTVVFNGWKGKMTGEEILKSYNPPGNLRRPKAWYPNS